MENTDVFFKLAQTTIRGIVVPDGRLPAKASLETRKLRKDLTFDFLRTINK